MPTILNEPNRITILARFAKLEPDSKPLWGRLTAPQLLCHLADQVRVAICLWEADPIFDGLWTKQPLKWLGIHIVPIPKNTQGPPEMFLTQVSDWHSDIKTLYSLLNEFESRPTDACWGNNPFFGKVNKRDWGVLIYRHFDYHLKQFGV